MIRRYWLLIAACLLTIPVLLAGCAMNGQSAASGAPAAPTTATFQPTITTVSSQAATVPPVPTATSAPSSHPTSQGSDLHGTVMLSVNALSYQPTSTITATLNNQSAQSIQFPDHLTNCSVVLVQREVNGTWLPVDPCKLMTVTKIHSLSAGQSLTVQFTAAPGQWLPGTYRCELSYGSALKASLPVIVFSSQFQVQ
jgi:hypothetical protein